MTEYIDIPMDDLEDLLGGKKMFSAVAADSDAYPGILANLTKVGRGDVGVMLSLAKNPNTPTGTLKEMEAMKIEGAHAQVLVSLMDRGTIWITEENQEEFSEALGNKDISIDGFGELSKDNPNCETEEYEVVVKAGTKIKMSDIRHETSDGMEYVLELRKDAIENEDEPSDKKAKEKLDSMKKEKEEVKKKEQRVPTPQ